jgi:hypothetical protein
VGLSKIVLTLRTVAQGVVEHLVRVSPGREPEVASVVSHVAPDAQPRIAWIEALAKLS